MQNYVDDKSILAFLEPTLLKISIVQSHNLTNTAGLQYDGREHSRRNTKQGSRSARLSPQSMIHYARILFIIVTIVP